MSSVAASVLLVCLATAPTCDQDHAEVYLQIRRGVCDFTEPTIRPYVEETMHYGNYSIVCQTREVADDWPDRTFKVEPIKPNRCLNRVCDQNGNPR